MPSISQKITEGIFAWPSSFLDAITPGIGIVDMILHFFEGAMQAREHPEEAEQAEQAEQADQAEATAAPVAETTAAPAAPASASPADADAATLSVGVTEPATAGHFHRYGENSSGSFCDNAQSVRSGGDCAAPNNARVSRLFCHHHRCGDLPVAVATPVTRGSSRTERNASKCVDELELEEGCEYGRDAGPDPDRAEFYSRCVQCGCLRRPWADEIVFETLGGDVYAVRCDAAFLRPGADLKQLAAAQHPEALGSTEEWAMLLPDADGAVGRLSVETAVAARGLALDAEQLAGPVTVVWREPPIRLECPWCTGQIELPALSELSADAPAPRAKCGHHHCGGEFQLPLYAGGAEAAAQEAGGGGGMTAYGVRYDHRCGQSWNAARANACNDPCRGDGCKLPRARLAMPTADTEQKGATPGCACDCCRVSGCSLDPRRAGTRPAVTAMEHCLGLCHGAMPPAVLPCVFRFWWPALFGGRKRPASPALESPTLPWISTPIRRWTAANLSSSCYHGTPFCSTPTPSGSGYGTDRDTAALSANRATPWTVTPLGDGTDSDDVLICGG